MSQCLKIAPKVASYVYIFVKIGPVWRVFESLKLEAMVKQCYQAGQF